LLNFAIVSLNETENLAIEINSALATREMISKDSAFKSEMGLPNKVAESDLVQLKSFSPSYDVKLISAKGSIETQTVTITMLVKHKIVHQEICLNFGKANAKIYDFEGNEYLAKDAFVGALSAGYNYICNKIPTNVPVKCGITFRQILSDKKEMSFMTIKVGYKAQDGGQYEYGVIEITDLKVDWN